MKEQLKTANKEIESYKEMDIEAIRKELRDWIDGGSNKKLDEWYKKYSEFKEVG